MAGYKIIVVGAGPAGMMAAWRAAECVEDVALFEKNASLGRKLGLTGKGRCNLTNTCSLDEFLEKFNKEGQFLRDSFAKFFAPQLMRFFETNGLKLKTERQGRVFPITDTSRSVIDVLKKVLTQHSVDIYMSAPVKSILVENGRVKGVRLVSGEEASAAKVILATGGVTYPETGSSGDGLRIARDLGHRIDALFPGLVPLETKDIFVKDLQGLTLKNIRITFKASRKKIVTGIGELLFTHFGVSGPLVLDASAQVVKLLDAGNCDMLIDLKPGMSLEELDAKFQRELPQQGSLVLKNYIKECAPQRFVMAFLAKAKIDPDKKCHQISASERRKIAELFKSFPVSLRRARPISEAMVTSGGVSLKEVDPKTMASKKIEGLYFCGEILGLAGTSGGFNLQAAFSTGYLAGESAGSA